MGQQNKILIAGLLATVVSLPWSQFGTSVGVGIIALAGVVAMVKGELLPPKNKLLFSALVLGFIWCSVGLLWSENLSEGLSTINIKLPLLILPLSVFCIKWDVKKWSVIIAKAFVYSVFIAAIAGLLNGYTASVGGEDVQISHWSPYISHIRMGLFLALGWGILLLSRSTIPTIIYGVVAILSIWNTESVTGVVMFVFAGLYSFISLALPSYRTRSVIASITVVIIGSIAFLFVLLPTPSYGPLTTTTPWGGTYEHHPEKHLEENGNKVWNFIALGEMRPEWGLKSDIPFDSLDARGHLIRYTLIRYLTSLGLTKDGATVKDMSKKDVARVEAGHTSVRMSSQSGLNLRIDDLRFEIYTYMDGGDPNGNSVTMRVEAFKTGLHILKNNGISGVLFGVGTGDLPDKFSKAYVDSESRLKEEFWKRTHNQYLAWWIGLGLVGLVLWCMALFASWPFVSNISRLAWWILALSCLAEDTLDTQAGVTFAALVLTVFSSGIKSRD